MMKRAALLHFPLFLAVILAFTHASHAQLIAGPGVSEASSSQPVSNHTFSFSGTIPGQLNGALSVTFSIYPDQQSATALWTETQVVQITAEKYTVMLGSTSPTGLPPEIFSADQAHWLGVQVNGSEKRLLLVSVPYAMKAVNADQLGGLPFSEYVTAQQLQAALQSAATPGTSTSTKTTSTGPIGQAALAGTTPQPATDFTDNNTSEVLLVTQQGTGFAIHAITSSQAEAILAQNNSIGGTALHAVATSATGAGIGVLAETASPNGISGVFNNQAGGKILSLRNNGVEVAGVDVNGNLNTSGQVQASSFSGGGFGLFGIPQSAINATPFNNPLSVVARDSNGSFAANQVTASSFSGGGFGLFGIPQSAINATALNNPLSVVARDANGDFAANQITATSFSGGGFGLFGIPQSAINATPLNNPLSVVARDSNGSFAANQVTAATFFGGGFGLFGIPQSAINATPLNNPLSVVARDSNGDFAANTITATTFSGSGFGLFGIPQSAINATPLNNPFSVVARDANGGFATANLQVTNQLTSSGLVDFSGAVTAPVRTVLTANIPPLCLTSKELLLVTDAFPGQQLFVCNSTGNGWVLLGDGGGSAASSNVSGNTTGTLENVSQLGSGTALTVSSTSGAAVSASSTNGTAIHGDSTAVGVQGSSQGGVGLWAAATASDSTGTALLLSHASQGKLIDGGVSLGSGTDIFETFSVNAEGDVTFNGAMMSPYDTAGTWVASSLVKLTSAPGTFGSGTVAMTSPGDTSGVVGIISGLPASGSRIQVVQSGEFSCNFDGPATPGHYVGISKTTAGDCADIGATFPTDGQQVVGRVLSSLAAGTGRVLLFQSELHGGGGSSVTINTGDGLTGGPITSSGTISVADGGITAAKLAPNAVTSTSIADGSLTPAKIAGTAATLGVNTFSGTQTMPSVNVGVVVASGNISAGGGSFAGPTAVTTVSGTALAVSGGDSNNPGLTALNQAVDGIALQGTSTGNNAIGVLGRATGGQSVAGLFVNSQGNGRIISAGVGAANGSEVFSVDTAGNVFAGGAQVAQFSNSSLGTTPAGLAKLDINGLAVSTSPGDTSGAVGIVVSNAATFGPVRIAYGGTAFCVFDSLPHILDYVQISRTTAGQCSDAGPSYPTSGQVIGRVTEVVGAGGFVMLSGPNTQAIKSGVLSINTGSGLVGGPITSSGTISIANSGVTNAMLQNSLINVVPGIGISGGGPASLGGTITLSNTGALSFNGRSGNILAAPGDYSFAQIAGTAGASQLPSTTVYSNQSNTFTADQTIQGNLAASGNINTGGTVTANAFTGTSANLTGAATPTNSVLAVNDTGVSGSAISVNSANNPAALFISSGPTVFMAGKITGATTILSSNGDLTLNGTAHASAFSGDGSALTNVSAAKIGTLAPADIATNTALSTETAARQSADATLQSNIDSESTARQSADTTLQTNITAETTARQTDIANVQASIGAESQARQSVEASLFSSISAETMARQSDVSTLQTNINNVSAADAKLAASNTFTAGTQDFSGAGATLPVRTVLIANTPTACVASKELLIKTDAPAGQQLFICDDTGTTWNLVGDGAANGVSSFNGRSGSVTPASGDYSFAQISGAAASSQLPASLVYSNQANSFTGNQTVNGAVTATSFSGSGSSLTGVNAAALNGLASGSFAQLAAANTFTARQTLAASTTTSASLNVPAGSAPATPAAGDVWNTGSTLQYRDNASTTRSLVSTTQSGGLQLLKLTASISPTTLNIQSCTEQSFTVSGIATGDTLLSVSQPSTSSPGLNIAIGGFRVLAANTVAIQFCNVSRNSSTPTAGVYTFALMR